MNRVGLGPVDADVTPVGLRRAGQRAMCETIRALGIDAAHVVFGHTHRAGPLRGDDLGEWITNSGAQLHNTGCWQYEPSYLGARPEVSPYRAGFAVELTTPGRRG